VNPVLYGVIAGIAFGVVSVLIMIPIQFDDKKTAMLGSFFSRFAIGFLTAVVVLPVSGWVKGIVVGLLVSLPDAIVTKAYAPILFIGMIGGAIIGFLLGSA
jgi:hypothetical protein